MQRLANGLSLDREWTARAKCAQTDPDAMFVRGAAQKQARELCFHCPVRLECLADALTSNMEFGVWGGFTERDRHAILRNCPRITDWASHIQDPNDPIGNALREGRVPTASPRRFRRR